VVFFVASGLQLAMQDLNTSRFRQRASRVLASASEDDQNAALSQIKYSSQHISGAGGQRQQGDVADLRNLHDVAHSRILRSREAKKSRDRDREISAKATSQGEDAVLSAKAAAMERKNARNRRRESDNRGRDNNHNDNVDSNDTREDETTAAGITSLLQQSADLRALEIEQERQKHTELLFHMSDLVGGLKDSTILMNKLVVEQNEQLEQIGQEAEENVGELERQKQSMEKETKKMTMSFWTTVYTAAWLIFMFIVTYVVIKIFPKPVYAQALSFPPVPSRASSSVWGVRGRSFYSCIAASTVAAAESDGVMGAKTIAFEQGWGSRVAPGISHRAFPYSGGTGGKVRGLGIGSEGEDVDNAGVELVTLRLEDCLVASETAPTAAPAGSRLRDCIDAAVWSGLKGTTRLSLQLLDQYMNGDSNDGFLRRYINMLPVEAELLTPVHWKEEGDHNDDGEDTSFAALQEAYPPLARRVRRQRSNYRKLYQLLSSPPVRGGGQQQQQQQQQPGAVVPSAAELPYSRFVWAMECVSSRAFSGSESTLALSSATSKFQLGAVCSAACFSLAVVAAGLPTVQVPGGLLDRETLVVALATLSTVFLMPAVLDSTGIGAGIAGAGGTGGACVLLPVIDSCNHRSASDANCEMAYEVSKDAFVLRSKGVIPKGSELTISYGNTRDNDEFLQYFGFVEENNPHDRYRLVIEPSAPGKDRKEGEEEKEEEEVVVTRGPRAEWTMPRGLAVTDDQLKSALRRDLDRLRAARDAASAAAAGGGSKRWGLLAVFLAEKMKVVEAALVRLL
jgi:hypothetical protein